MNNIDNILEKYFEGISSPNEEKTLKAYFRGYEILPQHEVYKPLFVAFDAEKQIVAPEFEIPVANANKKRGFYRKLWISAISAAAITLLIVILFPFNNQSTIQSDDYRVFINGIEVRNPQKAQQYAEKMFRQADEIIRAGYKPVVEVNAIQTNMDADKMFSNVSDKINYIESIMQ